MSAGEGSIVERILFSCFYAGTGEFLCPFGLGTGRNSEEANGERFSKLIEIEDGL